MQLRARFIAHTNRFLSRVYPGPVRFDSANMDPLPFWAVGVGGRGVRRVFGAV